jgi:hypothetical protein
MTPKNNVVILVQEISGDMFAAEIAKLLLKGYHFHGSPYYIGDYHCQLMVNSLEVKTHL